ncbi:MAG: hypothetical protein DRP63_02200, partial [Planctomycetota bacterium]
MANIRDTTYYRLRQPNPPISFVNSSGNDTIVIPNTALRGLVMSEVKEHPVVWFQGAGCSGCSV